MKNIIIAIISIVVVSFINMGAARADNTTMGPVVDDVSPYWRGQVGGCVDNLAGSCGQCAGRGGISNCGDVCISVIQNCGNTIVAAKKQTNAGPSYRWVKRYVNKALAGLVSKEEFNRVIGELRDEIAALDGRVTAVEAKVVVHEARLDGHDDDIAELKAKDKEQDGRLDAVEKKDKEQDDKLAALSDEVMFELGASFFGAPHVQVIGAAAGLQLRIAENVAVVGDLGLGYSFDKDVALTAKGGVVFYVTDNFGIGPTALFAKESFDDDGDVEIGGGVELRFRTGHFFISGSIGLGAEGVLQNVGQRPDGEPLTDRKFGLAVMGMVVIGGEF